MYFCYERDNLRLLRISPKHLKTTMVNAEPSDNRNVGAEQLFQTHDFVSPVRPSLKKLNGRRYNVV